MSGWDYFANRHLITLFSATDYCGQKNAGGMLIFDKAGSPILQVRHPFAESRLNRHKSNWVCVSTTPVPIHKSGRSSMGGSDSRVALPPCRPCTLFCPAQLIPCATPPGLGTLSAGLSLLLSPRCFSVNPRKSRTLHHSKEWRTDTMRSG